MSWLLYYSKIDIDGLSYYSIGAHWTCTLRTRVSYINAAFYARKYGICIIIWDGETFPRLCLNILVLEFYFFDVSISPLWEFETRRYTYWEKENVLKRERCMQWIHKKLVGSFHSNNKQALFSPPFLPISVNKVSFTIILLLLLLHFRANRMLNELNISWKKRRASESGLGRTRKNSSAAAGTK